MVFLRLTFLSFLTLLFGSVLSGTSPSLPLALVFTDRLTFGQTFAVSEDKEILKFDLIVSHKALHFRSIFLSYYSNLSRAKLIIVHFSRTPYPIPQKYPTKITFDQISAVAFSCTPVIKLIFSPRVLLMDGGQAGLARASIIYPGQRNGGGSEISPAAAL